MSDFTILSSDQVSGDKRLDIFRNFDYQNSTRTAFAEALGLVGDGYWTSTLYPVGIMGRRKFQGEEFKKNEAAFVAFKTGCVPRRVRAQLLGTRVVTKYSSIKNECDDIETDKNGVKIAEYGEYPQSVPADEKWLEELLNEGKLQKTNKQYSICKEPYYEQGDFKIEKVQEYIYNGVKYARYYSKIEEMNYENSRWFYVEPIKWIIDEKNDLAISRNILFSGVCLNNGLYYGDFDKSYLKSFLDNFFSKEIVKGNSNNYVEENSSVFDEDFIDEGIVHKTEEPVVSTPKSPLDSKRMQKIQSRISENIERAGKSLDRMDDKSNEMIKNSFGYDKKEEQVSNNDEGFTILSSSNIEEITSDNQYASFKNGRRMQEQTERANKHLDKMNSKADEMIKKNSEKTDNLFEDEEPLDIPKKERTIKEITDEFNMVNLDTSLSPNEKHEKLNKLFYELAILRAKEAGFDPNAGSGPKF